MNFFKRDKNKPYIFSSPVKITIIYFLFSIAWIYFSDELVHVAASDIETIKWLSIYKGFLFVVITSAILYILIMREIRREKTLDEKLLESQRNFEVFANTTHELIWAVDSDKKFTYVNKASKKIFGLEPEDMMGRKISDFANEEMQKRNGEVYRDSVGKGAITDYENEMLYADGSIRTLLDNAVVFKDKNGKNYLTMGTSLDITERKLSEKRNKESEEKYKSLVETTHGIIWSIDNERRIEFINKAVKGILGYEPEELLGTFISDLVVEDKNTASYINSTKALQYGEPIINYEVRLKRKDGTFANVMLNSVVRKDGDGNLLGRTGSSIDITELKAVEKGSRIYNEQINLLYETSQKLNLSLDINDVCRTIFESLEGIVPSDSLVISTFDEENQTITCRGYWLEGKRFDVSNFPPFPLGAEGKGLQSTAIRSGKSFIVNDYFERTAKNKDVIFFNESGDVIDQIPDEKDIAHSALIIPLKLEGKVTGVLQILSFEKNKYTVDHLRFVESLSNFISAAQQNALLYTKVNKELTGRRLVENALRNSEEKYRNLIETSHGVVWAVDEAGVITFINESVKDVIGYKPEELIGKHFSFTEKKQNAFFYKLRKRALEKNNQAQFENIFWHKKTGVPVSFLNNVVFKYDENGKFTGITGNSADITALKESEAKIKASEEKYRTIVETANEGLMILDENEIIRFANFKMAEQLGYTIDEITGLTAYDIVFDDQHEIVTQKIKGRKNGLKDSFEIKHKRKDGTPFWVIVSASPLTVADGKYNGTLVMQTDINEQKISQIALELSEEKYRNLIETAHGLVWIIDINGNVSFINKTCKEILGYGYEELTGKPVDYLVPEEQKLKDNSAIETSLSEGKTVVQFETVMVHKSGKEVNMLVNLILLKDEKGALKGSTARALDITEWKKLEQEKKKINEYIGLLYDIGQRINTTLDLNIVYSTLCETLSEIIPCDGMFISTFNENTQLITCRAHWANNKMQDVSSFPDIPLEAEGKGTQSIAIRTGNSLFINNYQEILKTNQTRYYIDENTGEVEENVPDDADVTRSALIVPLKIGNKVTGVIQMLNYQMNAFSQSQLKILESLALHIASAQQNALLYQLAQEEISERKNAEAAILAYSEQTKILYTAGQKLNLSLNISEICRTIFDSLKKLVPADSLVLSSYDDVNKLITFRGYWVENHELDVSLIPPLPLGKGVQSTAIIEGKAMLVNDYQQKIKKNKSVYYIQEAGGLTEDEPREDDKIKSAIVIPLKIQGKVTGVLQVFSLVDNKYNEEQLRLVESYSNYVAAAQQNALLFEKVNSELTERRAAEEALRKSEEKYHVIFESTGTATLIVEEDSTISMANMECFQLTGYTINELVGRKWTDFVAKESLEEMMKNHIMRRTEPEKAPTKYEVCLINKKGEVRDAILDIGIIYETRQSIVSIIDITDQKQASEALRINEEKYRNIVETANEGIWIIDEFNKTSFVNRRMATMLEYETEDMLGKPMFEFMEINDPLIKESESLNSSGLYNIRHEAKFIKKSGEILWTFLSLNPLFDSEGNHNSSMAMITDINDWKKSQDALKESEFFFRQSQRAANVGSYKTDFINGVWESSEVLDKIFGINKDYKRSVEGWLDIIHPEDHQMMNDYLVNEVIAKQVKFDKEYRIIRKNDGQTRWVFGQGDVDFDDIGNILSMIGTIQDITERVETQENLMKSELQYRTLIETSPLSVRMLDLNGNIIYANAETAKMYGYENVKELIGLNVVDLASETEKVNAAESLAAVLKQGRIKQKNIIYRKKDGALLPAELTSSLLKDSEGNPTALLSIVQDITERKMMEDKLKESEVYYRTLIETVPVGIVLLSISGKIEYVTPRIYEMFHLPDNFDYSGTDYLHWIIPDERELAVNRIQQILETGDFSNANYNYELLRYDKTTFWANTNSSPNFDTEGQLKGLLIAIQDISEIKKVQDELFENKEKLNSILTSAMDVIITVDDRRKIVLFNNAAEKLFKCTAENAIGKDLNNFIPERFHNLHNIKLEEFNKTGSTARHIGDIDAFTALRSDGVEIPVEISISKADIGGKVFSTAIIRDITLRLKYETDLKVSNEKLHTLAAHLQSAREDERLLISRDMHDQLGQDLTALKMDIVMLAKDIDKNKSFPPKKDITGELRNMADLTDRTIKWVRKLSTDLRPDVLDRLGLYEAVKWHGEEFQKRSGIKFTAVLNGKDKDINPEQSIVLFRIFQESLTNVLRHSGAARVRITMNDVNESLNMLIEDNGRGITNEEIERNKSLGLLGMKERAYLLGGTVNISGTENKGTKIEVIIPKIIAINHG